MDNQQIEPPRLAVAVTKAIKEQQVTRRNLARSAGVTNDLVGELYNVGDAGTAWRDVARKSAQWIGTLARDGGARPSNKLKSGKTGSLSRVYASLKELAREDGLELGFSIEDALKDFGLSSTSREIELALENRTSHSRAKQKQLDSLMDRVGQASRIGMKERLKVLNFDWPPFNKQSTFSKLFDSGDTKLGELLAKAWLGSISPMSIELGIETESDFQRAISAVAGEGVAAGGDSGAVTEPADIIVGLYDSSARRFSGLTFVNLPGVANALGVGMPSSAAKRVIELMSSAAPSEKTANPQTIWDFLLTRSKDLFQEDFRFIVIQGEVGDLFLQGPCGVSFEPENAQVIRVPGRTDILEEIARQYRISGSLGGKTYSPIVIADSTFLIRLWEYLETQESQDPTIGKSDLLPFTRKWLLKGKISADEQLGSFVDRSLQFAPQYRGGVSLSTDEPKFAHFVDVALKQDLLTNAVSLAGYFYADMLLLSEELRVTPISQDLADFQSARLKQATLNSLQYHLDSPKAASTLKQDAKLRLEEVAQVWK